jgi:tetratricopeptide (TPR) repeat protein
MTTVAEALDLARRHHQAGDLRQAEQIYRQILQVDPHHEDALQLLGLLSLQAGDSGAAIHYLSQAIQLRPDWAEVGANLGVALATQGRLDEAVASFRQALRLKPDYASAHYNLAGALRQQGQLGEAVASYREALRFRPDNADALTNLGNALTELARLDEAVLCYRDALRLRPGSAETHYNLAGALRQQDKLAEAVTNYQEALRLRPDHAEALNNLGTALREQGRLVEAVASYRQALRLRPTSAEALNNLGGALCALAQLPEALTCFDEALRLRPEYAEAHTQRAMLRLLTGDFAEGWPEYEWRWRCQGTVRPPFTRPRWDGSDVAGKTVLLWAEQGLGDTLQFVRYAARVKARGATVLLECPAALHPLLTHCPGIDRLLTADADRPAFDVHAPLMSLPGIFGTMLAEVPAPVPYLSADPRLVAHWRQDLQALGGLRVGVCWQGNPGHARDRQRSFPLSGLEPLARLPGVRLVSLQRGPGVEQVAALRGRLEVTELGAGLDQAAGPFMDTAAVMTNLDLVISCDTAGAHLAGALGVPVWLALAHAADWRWLVDREDSPWYPTMCLFRQPVPGDWAAVFERMAAALGRLARAGADEGR